MLYTVKEIASLANVTVKTLYHYHKIGLLIPCEISAAGYRLYGQAELERLQQILFYRELDFSLKDIGEALCGEANREKVLLRQRRLLSARMKHFEQLIRTLDNTILHAEKGETMEEQDLFKGFTGEEWTEALAEQSDYLKDRYGFDLTAQKPVQADEMNEMARETIRFQTGLAKALRDGVFCRDEQVKTLLAEHFQFMNAHGHPTDAKSFLQQTRFLVSDDFHRKMLENEQVGLAYYLLAAAEANAETEQ